MANLMYQHHVPFWILWTEDTCLEEIGPMLVFLQLMANEVETHKIADQPTPPKELAWKVWMAKVKTFSLFSKGIHTSNLFVE